MNKVCQLPPCSKYLVKPEVSLISSTFTDIGVRIKEEEEYNTLFTHIFKIVYSIRSYLD